jgi:phage gpG-like protein
MLTATVVGVGDVTRRLEGIPGAIAERLRETIAAQTLEVLRLAKQKTSGDVLRNRTGTLRRKLNMEMQVGADRIAGSVGIKLSYAAAHEFGSKATGTTMVSEHQRRLNIVRRLVKNKELKTRTTLKVVETHSGVATVREHQRNWRHNLPERSYMRTALAERRQAVLDAISRAVGEGIGE